MPPLSANILCLGVALLALLALLGERQFAAAERIPVHWAAGARPDLFAPRRVGLAIFPFIGLVLLLALAFSRQPVFVLAGALLIIAACNLLFFRAVGRSLQVH